ncbi:oleate hydratase [Microvirga sp. 17 mud 1-3]|uniref:oleate hydratase n=1 Tax=Microvirga sp. 17 mud 1-3 TaxID=2082949 RepID=UPI000D6B0465|nr:oleate hydratase [Microvirga sp. 17 mud 1-3]AWM87536.1 oleate hydratase [Microvirga sp. 17 mud 1-3]
MKAHLVGGGMASLAAAAYLIRDGGILATNITVYEAGERLGGAMTMAGDPASGYILPTGRVFEKEYRCTRELLSLVPSASDPGRSIAEELAAFNARYGYDDRARIVGRDGRVEPSPHFGLSTRDKLDLVRLALTPEAMLEGRRIDECFSESFFGTEFWILWTSMMAFLPQHSAAEMRRYIYRFLHILPDLSTLRTIHRTRYNQYEDLIKPIAAWLERQGVSFLTGAFVRDVESKVSSGEIVANALDYVRDGAETTVEIGEEDLVLITNGSQTTDLSFGTATTPPEPHLEGRSFALWQKLAQGRKGFGRPDVFFGPDHVKDTKWVTFTVTTTDPTFFRLIAALSGSEPGRGGLMTLKDSHWLVTLVLFHQPEFVDQPSGTMVWWGYGTEPDKIGNVVHKPMSECSGAEILREVLHHLRFEEHLETIMSSSICIPCLLPYATSILLPRGRTDRAPVVPEGSVNVGFIGQFAELPLETAFTMEYSVRSAREAVSSFLKLDVGPPPVYQGHHDPEALYNALKVLA